jgi:plastocyanin
VLLRLLSIVGFALITGSLITGCSGAPGATALAESSTQANSRAQAASVTYISIRSLQFSPATIEVKSGGVVEWKNDDLVPHTATSRAFDSGAIASGQTWRHTFTNVGAFPYVCTFHPQMKGVVNVK